MTELTVERRQALMQCYVEGASVPTAAIVADVHETTAQYYFNHFRQQNLPRLANPDDLAVPTEVIADRDRRAGLMPRDLVGWICGDPLPGYSALERR